jgi:adenylate kinase
VSDEVVNGIVSERLDQPDCVKGFILDGYPRTTAQAEALSGMLEDKGVALDAVVAITADAETLIARIVNRARESGGARADDNEQVVRNRLEVYAELTAPLVAYYKNLGLVKSVDGMQPIEDVTKSIITVLES